MEEWIHHVIKGLPFPLLLGIIAITLYTLGKGADILVDEAVTLSTRWGVPKTLIGATIVSLGTTTPEAAVSVLAAVKGSPDLALGNAVGSIICDTGLILGLAALIAPLPLNRAVVNRQGWLQLGAGVLLVIACLPYGALHKTFSDQLLFSSNLQIQTELDSERFPQSFRQEFDAAGISLPRRAPVVTQEAGSRWGVTDLDKGRMYIVRAETDGTLSVYRRGGGRFPQWVGFMFLGLLALYIWQSIRWSKKGVVSIVEEEVISHTDTANTFWVAVKLVGGIAIVVGSSWALIPAVREAAERLRVPESIIAATLVAFGTSLPELVTCVTAARRGHGELAVGNVIGADILNVLFVSGAAAAVTKGGLIAPPNFFLLLFPMMLFILIVFRIGVFVSGSQLKRPFGFILIAAYIAITVLVYIR